MFRARSSPELLTYLWKISLDADFSYTITQTLDFPLIMISSIFYEIKRRKTFKFMYFSFVVLVFPHFLFKLLGGSKVIYYNLCTQMLLKSVFLLARAFVIVFFTYTGCYEFCTRTIILHFAIFRRQSKEHRRKG